MTLTNPCRELFIDELEVSIDNSAPAELILAGPPALTSPDSSNTHIYGYSYAPVICTVPVAEWSAPIEPGNLVALNEQGQAYNLNAHGMLEGLGDREGLALTGTDGPIGEGEAQINVRLGAYSLPEPAVPVAEEQVWHPGDPLVLPEVNVPGNGPILPPPTSPYPYESPQKCSEDITELTAAEQTLLEVILMKLANTEVEDWPEEDRENFTSLYNKLVD